MKRIFPIIALLLLCLCYSYGQKVTITITHKRNPNQEVLNNNPSRQNLLDSLQRNNSLFSKDGFREPNFVLERLSKTKYLDVIFKYIETNFELGGTPYDYIPRVRTYFIPKK